MAEFHRVFTVADRGEGLDGDVVLIDPARGAAERLDPLAPRLTDQPPFNTETETIFTVFFA